jgi:hypothetical protein
MNAGMGPLYCSDSAPVEGVLSFFPQLRDLLDIHYQELEPNHANGKVFFTDEKSIRHYLSTQYELPLASE